MRPIRNRDVLMGRMRDQSPEDAEQAEMATRKALINAEADVRELKMKLFKMAKLLIEAADFIAPERVMVGPDARYLGKLLRDGAKPGAEL